MMQNDDCEDVCATSSSCGFKNGLCVSFIQGFCSHMCFEEMLFNGTCDEECLT